MSWHFLNDTTPKARKVYRCHVCYEAIEVGEYHFARRGIDEMGPHTTRMHLECEELTRTWRYDDWECHSPGDVERPKAKAEVAS